MVKNFYCSFLVPATSTPNATKKLVCSCGKNNKEGHESCVQDANGRTRCPCIGKGVSCSRDCRCKRCQNKQAYQKPKEAGFSLSCKCKVDKVKSNEEYVACSDGKRKTKCPCVRNETQCGSRCLCKNCGNCGTSSLNLQSLTPRSRKRKRDNPSPFKKQCSAEFLASNGIHPSSGPWTTHETCLLLGCASLISVTAVEPSVQNITLLYNNITTSRRMCYPIREKTVTQVSRKLSHLAEKQTVLNILGNTE